MHLTFREIAEAVQSLTTALPFITGYDLWREPTGQPFLADITPEMSKHGVVPHTKPEGNNVGTPDGLWFRLHMQLLLPAIHSISQQAGETQALENFALDLEEAQAYFGPLSQLIRHIKDRAAYTHESLREAIENIDPCSKRLDHSQPLARPSPKTNETMMGRLILAKLASQETTPERVRAFGFPPNTLKYLKGGKADIFKRISNYFLHEVPHCPIYDWINSGETHITAQQMFALYAWFARPEIVEMVQPNLQGAAQKTAGEIADFLDLVNQECKTNLGTFPTPSSLLANESFINDLGRIAALMDEMAIPVEGGKALRVIAESISDDDHRSRLWGHPDRYEPYDNELALFAKARELAPWGTRLKRSLENLRSVAANPFYTIMTGAFRNPSRELF